MVGLSDFAYYMPSEISGGMQKRAAIARAMALDPKILFFDEPTAGLDPETSRSLDNLILDLSKVLGITFVIITHDVNSIFRIAKRLIFLEDGCIIDDGSPRYLKNSDNKNIKSFFNDI